MPTGPVRRWNAIVYVVGALLGLLLSPRVAGAQAADQPFSFVVIGHLRGNSDEELYPRIDELIREIRRLKPDLLFLTGDLIWGSIPAPRADLAKIEAQWDALDAKLATLGIPIYRVPGNHDIHDPVTRDVFFRRYGTLPRTVSFRGSRFFLLNSTFTPVTEDSVPIKPGKTVRLDSAQVAFVRRALEGEPARHDFLLMHHVLWFNEKDPWWTEVHPTLARHGVAAVFSGDLGPAMFTHMTRDSIEYLRTTVNAIVDKPLSPLAPQGLIRTLQFENFLFVQVAGPTVTYEVKTVGALTSQAFSPSRWRDVFGDEPDPAKYYDPASYRAPPRPAKAPPGLIARLRSAASPRRLALVAVVGLAGFGVGVLVGRARGRRGRPGA